MGIRSAGRRFLFAVTPPARRLVLELAIDRATGRAPDELRILPSLARPGSTAIDVGANRGHYALAMTRCFGTVVAVEPNAELTGDLERCGARNLTIHHCALSSESGEAELYIPRIEGREQAGFASLDRKAVGAAESVRVVKVPVCRLDDLGLSRVGLMKINAPGHEVPVLEGARRTIEADRPTVISQVWPESRATVERFLGTVGLLPHVVVAGRLEHLKEGLGGYRGDRVVFVFTLPFTDTRRA
ncbi:MAG: FkbM family methyltransferase [Acidobacteria bacterium]|nr:FkbM family methyltransferase [Acidobacteriota bacterium]